MSNPFSNIDTKKSHIPLQKNVNGSIEKKKAGRPQRPNMERYIIKMDKSLHAQLIQYANSQGINKSAAITQAVRKLIS
jgi:hypothetical protein